MSGLLKAIISGRKRNSYIVSEDFDGVGAPLGWINQNGVGTVDWDNTTSISPQGGHCLYVSSNSTENAANSGAAYILPVSLGTFSYYALMRCGNVGANRWWWFTDQDSILFRSGADDDLDGVSPIPGHFVSYGGPSLWMHIWLDRTPTEKRFFTSTTSIKPALPNVTRTGSFPNITKLVSSFNSTMWLDKVRLSANSIGSNPI